MEVMAKCLLLVVELLELNTVLNEDSEVACIVLQYSISTAVGERNKTGKMRITHQLTGKTHEAFK